MDMEEEEEEDRFTWNLCVHVLKLLKLHLLSLSSLSSLSYISTRACMRQITFWYFSNPSRRRFSLSRSSSSHGIRADEKRELGFALACDAFPCAAFPCVAALPPTPADDLPPTPDVLRRGRSVLRRGRSATFFFRRRLAALPPAICLPAVLWSLQRIATRSPCLPAAPAIRLPRRDLFFGDGFPAEIFSSPTRSAFCRCQQPTPCQPTHLPADVKHLLPTSTSCRSTSKSWRQRPDADVNRPPCCPADADALPAGLQTPTLCRRSLATPLCCPSAPAIRLSVISLRRRRYSASVWPFSSSRPSPSRLHYSASSPLLLFSWPSRPPCHHPRMLLSPLIP